MIGTMPIRPVSATGLYWSLNGEVACAHHAPDSGDPRWSIEGWAPIKAVSGHVQGSLYQYQCQKCAADGVAVEWDAGINEIRDRINKAAEHRQRADDHRQAADRLIESATRRQAEGPPRHIVRHKKPRP